MVRKPRLCSELWASRGTMIINGQQLRILQLRILPMIAGPELGVVKSRRLPPHAGVR